MLSATALGPTVWVGSQELRELGKLTRVGDSIVVRSNVRSSSQSEKGGEFVMSHRLRGRQSGQGMVEYALILVLVSIVVIVILLTMGNQIQNVFSNVVAALG